MIDSAPLVAISVRDSGHGRLRLAGFCLALALSYVAFAVGSAFLASTALAQPASSGPDAGEEPPDGPIVYNLQPEPGAVIPVGEAGDTRVGATIETQHDGGVSSAEISMDGQKMPAPSVGGAYSYLQSASVGMGDLGLGEHTVEVTATDSQGRTGGHEWTFTVADREPHQPEQREQKEQTEGSSGEPAPESTQAPGTQIQELPDTGGTPLWPVGGILGALAGAALLVAGRSVWRAL